MGYCRQLHLLAKRREGEYISIQLLIHISFPAFNYYLLNIISIIPYDFYSKGWFLWNILVCCNKIQSQTILKRCSRLNNLSYSVHVLNLDKTYLFFLSFFKQAIYLMTEGDMSKIGDAPELRTRDIFVKMDTNSDGVLSKEEFIKGCLGDETLYKLLACSEDGENWNRILFIYIIYCKMRSHQIKMGVDIKPPQHAKNDIFIQFIDIIWLNLDKIAPDIT